MKVELITYTPDPERVVAMAAKSCHTVDTPEMKEMSEGEIKGIIRITRDAGHHSVLEHASFTFAIDDVSRALTHQLVRHRLASYSQQSQRYVNLKPLEYVSPPTVNADPEVRRKYEEIMEYLERSYEELVEMGITLEDARYILPNATHTNIVVTMNARELINFFTLRTCMKAQWEIRALAYIMLKKVRDIAPTIFERAGPACLRGACPEGEVECAERMRKGLLKGERP